MALFENSLFGGFTNVRINIGIMEDNMSLVSKNVCDRRSERIRAFVDEVRCYLYNECFSQDVSVVAIDCFCHDMFVCMNRNNMNYSFFELLHMLVSEAFLAEAFSRYQAAVKN